MEPKLYAVGAIILLLILAARRSFRQRSFFRKYTLVIDGFLFAGCFALLGMFFYQKKLNAGLFAVGLGAVAIGKYLYDQSMDNQEARDQESE